MREAQEFQRQLRDVERAPLAAQAWKKLTLSEKSAIDRHVVNEIRDHLSYGHGR